VSNKRKHVFFEACLWQDIDTHTHREKTGLERGSSKWVGKGVGCLCQGKKKDHLNHPLFAKVVPAEGEK